MQLQRDFRYKRRNPFGKALVALALLIGASFGLAFAWQNLETGLQHTGLNETSVGLGAAAASPGPESSQASPAALQQRDLPTSQEALENPAKDLPDEAGDDGEYPAISADFSGSNTGTAETEAASLADWSYFDDALFIGDSVSTGIPGYHIADNAAVVAFTGINPDNINHKEVIDTPDGRITMLEAAKRKAPRSKIYIMLGSNGLDFDKDAFINGYRTFVTDLRKEFPHAIMYLQSMPPVTKDVGQYYSSPNINKDRICEYNEAIRELAQSMGFCYLDVYSALADKDGMLPVEASPTDGMHFTPEYYYKWFDYLRANAVEAK